MLFPNLGFLAEMMALAGAASKLPAIMDAIETQSVTQSVWEVRQCCWQQKWGESDDFSEGYRKLADIASAYGYSDLINVRPWFLGENRPRMKLKMIAERLTGHSLPDINPQKCLEYAKETLFSAENWYNGCSG